MFHLIYVSRSVAPMSSAELARIQTTAIAHNSAQDITGVLLYRATNFIQLLEGEEARIVPLFGRIRRDGRHCDVKLMYLGPAAERLFPSWSMGVVNMHEDFPVEHRRLHRLLMAFRAAPSEAKYSSMLRVLETFRRELVYAA